MRIGVNARLLIQGRMEGIGWHAWEIISRLIRLCPEHHFVLFYDRRKHILIPQGSNTTTIVLPPQSRHPLLIHAWCEYSLRYACQREKLDFFYSPEPLMPSGMSIPSAITVHDMTPFRYPETMPWSHRWYYRYILKRNLYSAHHIFTVSEFSKNEIISVFKMDIHNITVIYNAARDIFKPIPIEVQQTFRLKHTSDCPYFIAVGAIHSRKNILTTIQAFERFKSEYHLDHKLVLAGKFMGSSTKVSRAIQQATHRSDIIQTGYVDESQLVLWLASSAALINLSEYEGFGMPLVEAFQTGVPVIAADRSCYPEIAGDAAILVDPQRMDKIVEAMIEVVHDPDPWISKGFRQVSRFDWDRSAGLVRSVILRGINWATMKS